MSIDVTKSLSVNVTSFMNDANISNSELLTLDGYDNYLIYIMMLAFLYSWIP